MIQQPPVFPSLPGQGWPVMRAPRFATRTQRAISGRQLRVIDQLYPIWTWTLSFGLLRDAHDLRTGANIGLGIGYDELRALAGFFLAMQGAFGVFLFDEPSDDNVTDQALGIGNNTQTAFGFGRTFGGSGFFEPLLAVRTTSAPLSVYIDGVLQSPSAYSCSSQFGWTGDASDTVTFASAPAALSVVSASFSYYFPVHFVDDNMDLENFVLQLWQAKQVKFESVLA
jgi:uncharacterized protein (TIGR02217 family)